MPVQNNHSKICARPDLATSLLYILKPSISNIAYCVKKVNLHFSYVLEDDLFRKYLVNNLPPKSQK